MLNMKKVLTLVCLGLALVITTATSKKTNNKPIERFYTNYYVETNCTNSIAQSKIQVKTEKTDQLPI
jgi:hypothetical protein